MNWLTNALPPKIKNLLTPSKKEVPENLWIKCPETGEMVFHRDLEANQYVIPASGFHMRMPARQRDEIGIDEGRIAHVEHMPQGAAIGRAWQQFAEGFERF